MRVTIISDASCDGKMQCAAYAFWAASKRGKLRHSGAFKEAVRSSAEAETKAIINAIHVAQRAGVLCDGDALLVQVDAIGAIHALTGKLVKTRTREKFAPLVRVFREFTEARGIVVEFRHIKGHTKESTHTENRFRAQRRVDKDARSAMRRARSAAKTKAPKEAV